MISTSASHSVEAIYEISESWHHSAFFVADLDYVAAVAVVELAEQKLEYA